LGDIAALFTCRVGFSRTSNAQYLQISC